MKSRGTDRAPKSTSLCTPAGMGTCLEDRVVVEGCIPCRPLVLVDDVVVVRGHMTGGIVVAAVAVVVLVCFGEVLVAQTGSGKCLQVKDQSGSCQVQHDGHVVGRLNLPGCFPAPSAGSSSSPEKLPVAASVVPWHEDFAERHPVVSAGSSLNQK